MLWERLFSSTAAHVPAPYAAEDVKKNNKEKTEPETAGAVGQTGSQRDTGGSVDTFHFGKEAIGALVMNHMSVW